MLCFYLGREQPCIKELASDSVHRPHRVFLKNGKTISKTELVDPISQVN